jgi:hypothetical protein
MVCPIEADSVDLLASQSERFELRIRRRIPEQKHVSLNRPHGTLRSISQSTRRTPMRTSFLFAVAMLGCVAQLGIVQTYARYLGGTIQALGNSYKAGTSR